MTKSKVSKVNRHTRERGFQMGPGIYYPTNNRKTVKTIAAIQQPYNTAAQDRLPTEAKQG